jgi:hypothetical protein
MGWDGIVSAFCLLTVRGIKAFFLFVFVLVRSISFLAERFAWLPLFFAKMSGILS